MPQTTPQGFTVAGLITLYQLDTTRLGGPVFYFNSAEDTHRLITWGGQPYAPLPMDVQGFEYSTRGTIAQPQITVSNLYGAGNLLLDSYAGLLGADLTRIQTLERFLDDGATPDPNAYISRDVYTVAQKTSHTPIAIIFKLAARIDQEGTQLPRRQILRDTCDHLYRVWNTETGAFDYSAATCPYTGAAFFDTNDNSATASTDMCSHTLTGCRRRFGGGALPARLFPGVGKVK
jgi:lambda family phage minor tail protein L